MHFHDEMVNLFFLQNDAPRSKSVKLKNYGITNIFYVSWKHLFLPTSQMDVCLFSEVFWSLSRSKSFLISWNLMMLAQLLSETCHINSFYGWLSQFQPIYSILKDSQNTQSFKIRELSLNKCRFLFSCFFAILAIFLNILYFNFLYY